MKAFILFLLLFALLLATHLNKHDKQIASVWDLRHIERGTLDVVMHQSKNIA